MNLKTVIVSLSGKLPDKMHAQIQHSQITQQATEGK
jgi:hypothetical protein